MLLGLEWPGTLTSPVASNSLSWYPQLLSPGLSLIARGAIISLLSGVSRFDFPRWVKDPSFFLPEVSRGRPPSHPALSPSIPGCAPSRSASTSSRGAPRVLAQASGGSMSRRWCWLRLSPGCGWTDGWAVAAGLGGGGPAPRSAPPRPLGPPGSPETWAPGQDLPLPAEDLPALGLERGSLCPQAQAVALADQQVARSTSPASVSSAGTRQTTEDPLLLLLTRSLVLAMASGLGLPCEFDLADPRTTLGLHWPLPIQPAVPSLTGGLVWLLPGCPGKPSPVASDLGCFPV